jgi:hypothetical protein
MFASAKLVQREGLAHNARARYILTSYAQRLLDPSTRYCSVCW